MPGQSFYLLLFECFTFYFVVWTLFIFSSVDSLDIFVHQASNSRFYKSVFPVQVYIVNHKTSDIKFNYFICQRIIASKFLCIIICAVLKISLTRASMWLREVNWVKIFAAHSLRCGVENSKPRNTIPVISTHKLYVIYLTLYCPTAIWTVVQMCGLRAQNGKFTPAQWLWQE